MMAGHTGTDAEMFMSPEDRATIMGHIIRIAAPIAGPVDHCWLSEEVRKAMGRKEEEVGLEILRATSTLILAGIFDCNTYDAAMGEITYRSGTTLRLGTRMMSFIWKEELNDEGGAAA